MKVNIQVLQLNICVIACLITGRAHVQSFRDWSIFIGAINRCRNMYYFQNILVWGCVYLEKKVIQDSMNFVYKMNLKNHTQKNRCSLTNNDTFKCAVCESSFSSNKAITQHFLMHKDPSLV